jgi:hypothetical protein
MEYPRIASRSLNQAGELEMVYRTVMTLVLTPFPLQEWAIRDEGNCCVFEGKLTCTGSV